MFGKSRVSQISSLSQHSVNAIFSAYQEKIPENGEDSFYFSLNDKAGIVAVFDGCGGSGAKIYPVFHNKTGAYLASRAVSAAVQKWFLMQCDNENSSVIWDASSLKDRMLENLSLCEEYSASGESGIQGSLSKKFPTTAAIATVKTEKDHFEINCFWAGDSRLYYLSSSGLAQLSSDDLNVTDAFENLTADGGLTNVISISKDFTIHQSHYSIFEPGLLFAATDGCFGYISTPMEFEYLILNSLSSSSSFEGWEKGLQDCFAQYAEDDFTLCGFVCGFDTFHKLKEGFSRREETLFKNYISGLEKKSYEGKRALWETYSLGYYRLLDKDKSR